MRKMIFQSAATEICVATYQQFEKTIYIETHHSLPFKELKKVRQMICEKGHEAGWTMPPESELQLCINGVLSKYIPRFRRQHILQTPFLTLVRPAQSPPLLLCVCAIDTELDEEFLLELQTLSSTAEVGYRALLSKVLQKAENLELILADMMDGIILCNDQGRVQFMNEKARKLCGFEKILERGAVLRATPLCDLHRLLMEAVEDGVTQLNRVIPLGNSRTRLMGVNIQWVKNSSGNPVAWLLILRDITASWQSDQIRSMIAMASHELNTPLASIKNTVDLLLDQEAGPLNDSQGKFLRIIQDDITRLLRMLHDLLDLSRLEKGRLQLDRRRHVRIEFIINKVIESYSVLAESRGIVLKAKVPSGISGFIGDRDRITQILVNLVDNAIKYSHFGSRVVISAKENKNELIVAVADQGIGIPEAEIDHIFERFVQLESVPDGVHRGFGLGLSIARDIVESHGGKLWVKSKVGEGSTFYFSIPKEKSATISQQSQENP